MFLKVITFFNSIVQEARTLNSDNVQNAVWHGHSDFHVIGNQVVFSPIASGKSSSSSWKMLPPWRIQSSQSKESAVITVTSDSDLEDQQTWSQEDLDSVPLMKLGPWCSILQLPRNTIWWWWCREHGSNTSTVTLKHHLWLMMLAAGPYTVKHAHLMQAPAGSFHKALIVACKAQFVHGWTSL
jgi:hypothetical protein